MSLKQVERAIEANLSKSYLVRAKNDSKIVNVFLSNSSFATERYKKDFWYNGDILETGLPRNDVLFKDKNALRNKINYYFNLSGNKKLLLYAPTFRKDFNTDIYIDDFKNILDALASRFGGEWIVLYHLHPNIADKVLSIVYSDLVLNGAHYPDFQEIMVASDVLITDYSSVMFEFSFMQKPVFLLMADKEDHINDRNFAMSLDSIPYPQSLNLNELIEDIKRFNKSNYLDNVTKFFNTNAFF